MAGHCARFFNQSGVRFWEMAPHGRLSSTGICMARPGVEYVVYSPKGETFTVNLTAAANVRLRVRWHNPRTGESQSAADVEGGQAVKEFAAPFAGDSVLHLWRRDP